MVHYRVNNCKVFLFPMDRVGIPKDSPKVSKETTRSFLFSAFRNHVCDKMIAGKISKEQAEFEIESWLLDERYKGEK